MIYDSEIWKDDLLKHAKLLKKRKRSRTSWSDTAVARLEQCVMLGFYSIRKLIEAHKLSDSIAQQQISLVTYPWSGKHVTFMNWHRIDELYDFGSPGNQSHDLAFLCNQFVHSYVFIAEVNENGKVIGVLVSSDRQRHHCLYRVDLGRIIELFEEVGSNYPWSMQMNLNPETHDYEVVST